MKTGIPSSEKKLLQPDIAFGNKRKKTWVRVGIVIFLGLALLGGLLDKAPPKARPAMGPDLKAVKDYAGVAGYRSGPFWPEDFDRYLISQIKVKSKKNGHLYGLTKNTHKDFEKSWKI